MKETYQEQIARLFRQAAKVKDELRARYYAEQFNGLACVGYDAFVKSWAGQEWLKRQT